MAHFVANRCHTPVCSVVGDVLGSLKPGEEAAQLVFRVAGQFPETAVIPAITLGLFTGVPFLAGAGRPSPLKRSLRRLHDVRLVEELHANRVRLHPLVREFAARLTPPSETPGFRHDCAYRVVRAFEDFATLEDATRADGVDVLQETLMTALDFIVGGEDEPAEALHAMLRVVRREAHHLREWDPGQQANSLAQQVLFRAVTLGESVLAAQAERRLSELGRPALLARWRTLHESPALVRILSGHRGMVNAVAVSPDGRHAVTGSTDRTAAVWDLATGRRLHELAGHQGTVHAVAVSPDGRHVVTGSDDRTAAVWDLATGQRLRELAGHGDRVTSVAVSPDGRHAVTGSDDRTAAVWDLATGQRLRELAGHGDQVTSVAVSPDGRHLVTGSYDRTAAVWDLATGQRLRRLAGHRGPVSSVAVSPDGRHAVTGSYDRTAAVWDLATGERLRGLASRHRNPVTSVAVSPDGRHLVTGFSFTDHTAAVCAAVWDLATGEQLDELDRHRDAVHAVAVSPDGRHLVTGSADRTAAVWDLATGQRLRELAGHGDG